jgi:two-component system sensor histidine kinase PilS (NtrC family)
MASWEERDGARPQLPEGGVDLRRRFQWLIVLRVAVTSFLLVALALLQYGRSPRLLEDTLPLLQVLGGGVYLATVGYAVALWRRWNLRRLGIVQLMGDLVFVTALLHVTGGIDSGFSFLYMLTIIVGSLLFYGLGAFGMAIGATLFYGGVVGAQAAGWIPTPRFFVNPIAPPPMLEVVANICFNTAVFFVVALLCGYLAEQLRSTHRRLREKESDLERLHALTHQIVSSMGSGLLTVDAGDRITFINQTGEHLTGVVSAQVLGQNLSSLFPGLLKVQEGLAFPRRLEIEYTHPDGRRLFLGCSFSRLKSAPGGRILIFQDLTEVKAADERARRNERLAAVGELSAGMAHEIRNPLASIRGAIEMLSKDLTLTDYQARLMDIALREADRLNHLLTDFLQFAHPREVKRQPVPVAEFLADTVEVFLREADNRVGVRPRLEAPIDLYADGDPALLRQVVWNLLLNARDAMPAGGDLWITARPVQFPEALSPQGKSAEDRTVTKDGCASGAVEICFEDTGGGIPKDVIHRIFEPFFTTKSQGTGLGLSTVYRIVEAHEGAIQVQSEEGKGSTFIVWIPASQLSDRGAS